MDKVAQVNHAEDVARRLFGEWEGNGVRFKVARNEFQGGWWFAVEGESPETLAEVEAALEPHGFVRAGQAMVFTAQ